MTLPDQPCIGFDGKPALLIRRQMVTHAWKDKKGVWREYGYEVCREVPADKYRVVSE